MTSTISFSKLIFYLNICSGFIIPPSNNIYAPSKFFNNNQKITKISLFKRNNITSSSNFNLDDYNKFRNKHYLEFATIFIHSYIFSYILLQIYISTVFLSSFSK